MERETPRRRSTGAPESESARRALVPERTPAGDNIVDRLFDELDIKVNDGDDLLDDLRDGAWLDSQDFPPVNHLVDGLIAEGLNLRVGAPKIGKSWKVLGIALAVGAGGVALSAIRVTQRPVLYLALEDSDRRMQDRCRKLLHGDPIPKLFHYKTKIKPGRVVETITQWLGRQRASSLSSSSTRSER